MFTGLIESCHVYYIIINDLDQFKSYTHLSNKNNKGVNYFYFVKLLKQLSIPKLILSRKIKLRLAGICVPTKPRTF